MAGIRKRTWVNKSGKHACYEINCIINGQQVRKSGYATKQKAQEDLDKVTKEVSTNIKLKELCEYYINEHCQLRCKESTINLYKSYTNNNLGDIKYKKVKDITKRDIDLLVLDWKRNTFSNKGINDRIGFLRSVFKYGISNKWIYYNPPKEVAKLPKASPDIMFFNTDEMQEFEKIIEKFPFDVYVMFMVDMYGGFRISELIAFDWADIEFRDNTINVNKQFYKGMLSSPKTYTSTRKVIMPEFIMDLLKELKRRRTILSKIVFCSSTGGYKSSDKLISIWFKKAVKKMGKPDFKFHGLRHTYAAYLLSKGVSLKFVQEQLGHSTPQTTLNIYDHVMKSVNLEAMNLLNNIHFEHNLNTADFANA